MPLGYVAIDSGKLAIVDPRNMRNVPIHERKSDEMADVHASASDAEKHRGIGAWRDILDADFADTPIGSVVSMGWGSGWCEVHGLLVDDPAEGLRVVEIRITRE
jgi:hypothetical protein